MRAALALPLRRLGWTLALYVCLHVAVALTLNWNDVTAALISLDSEWYEHIALHGYVHNPGSPQAAESVFAFFPTWPLLLRAVGSLFPETVPLRYVGAFLALMFFAIAIMLINRRTAKDPVGLTPRTTLGLWCLVFAPGAWVFFSNHTEALFLLLSWGAFASAARGEGQRSFLVASVLAGLAALTRNQGVLVAFFVGWTLAARGPDASTRTRARTFILSGVLSGALFALWPLFQWLETGNPLMSTAAQKHWYVAQGFEAYVRNFFWISANNFWRALTFWGCLGVGVHLIRRGALSRPLGLYVLCSAVLWPLQGNNLPQAYRFSSVLFPVWFWLGDTVATRFAGSSKAVLARGAVRLAFLVATIILSSAYYTRVRWAY